MFTKEHFIWLLIIFSIIFISFIIIKKIKPSHKRICIITMILSIIFKIFHVALSMKHSEHGGMVIYQTQLSFHLCSIQVYLLVFINLIKNERIINLIKSFMVPSMLIGATIALFIPTEGASFNVLRVYQYFLIHGTYAFYGFYLIFIEKVDLSLKSYRSNLFCLTLVTIIAFFMNSVLEQYGTNFLFLRVPPMDNLPILNLNNGWYVYIISLMLIAITLVTLVHLPFIIKDIKTRRNLNKAF